MQVFLAVARTENLSVAAQDLAMSKSAVSQALTELEGRSASRSSSAPAADSFRPKADASSSAADELMERTGRHRVALFRSHDGPAQACLYVHDRLLHART
ncbi:MAG: LysR family transcriptional regulator [Sutterella wadsworthensis]